MSQKRQARGPAPDTAQAHGGRETERQDGYLGKRGPLPEATLGYVEPHMHPRLMPSWALRSASPHTPAGRPGRAEAQWAGHNQELPALRLWVAFSWRPMVCHAGLHEAPETNSQPVFLRLL